MPKRAYTPAEKKLVRRLLLIHAGNVTIVHHLTGFPKRTILNWRKHWDDDYDLYTDALAQNLISRANALAAAQQAEIQDRTTDSAFAQREDQLAQFQQIRANLMKHATSLSQNLALDDGQINQRVHALSRLIDRILLLDTVLDDQIPQDYPPNRISYGDESQGASQWDLPLQWTEENDAAQTETDQSGALDGFTQENANNLGSDLADPLEAKPKTPLAENDETSEHNHQPSDDISMEE